MEATHTCYVGISTPDESVIPWKRDLEKRPHIPGDLQDPATIDYMELLMDQLCAEPSEAEIEPQTSYVSQRIKDYLERWRDVLYALTEECKIPLAWDYVPNLSHTTSDYHDIVVTLNPAKRAQEVETIFTQCLRNPHLAVVLAQDEEPSGMLAEVMKHCNIACERIIHLPFQGGWEEGLKRTAAHLLSVSYVRKHGLAS